MDSPGRKEHNPGNGNWRAGPLHYFTQNTYLWH